MRKWFPRILVVAAALALLAGRHPNIQRVKAMVGKAGKTPKRINVCTSCLKAGKVTR